MAARGDPESNLWQHLWHNWPYICLGLMILGHVADHSLLTGYFYAVKGFLPVAGCALNLLVVKLHRLNRANIQTGVRLAVAIGILMYVTRGDPLKQAINPPDCCQTLASKAATRTAEKRKSYWHKPL